jgi:FAD/FMN-containing dehydrogenase
MFSPYEDFMRHVDTHGVFKTDRTGLREHEEQGTTRVFDSVAKFKGSISAENKVGSLKVDKLEKYKSPMAQGMVRAIKQALDPQNLVNPQRVLAPL